MPPSCMTIPSNRSSCNSIDHPNQILSFLLGSSATGPLSLVTGVAQVLWFGPPPSLVSSLITYELPEVAPSDQLFNVFFEVGTIFRIVSHISVIRTIQTLIPPALVPGQGLERSGETFLFHHSEDPSSRCGEGSPGFISSDGAPPRQVVVGVLSSLAVPRVYLISIPSAFIVLQPFLRALQAIGFLVAFFSMLAFS